MRANLKYDFIARQGNREFPIMEKDKDRYLRMNKATIYSPDGKTIVARPDDKPITDVEKMQMLEKENKQLLAELDRVKAEAALLREAHDNVKAKLDAIEPDSVTTPTVGNGGNVGVTGTSTSAATGTGGGYRAKG